MQLIVDSLVIMIHATQPWHGARHIDNWNCTAICAMTLKSKLTIRTNGEQWLRLWMCSCETQHLHVSNHEEQTAATAAANYKKMR